MLASTRSVRSSTRSTTTPSRTRTSRHPPSPRKPADAPVSYPFLWDTPQHDVVQWLGIAKNGGPLDIFTLSRNVGEVLGVFADFAIPEDPIVAQPGLFLVGQADRDQALEDQLKALWSPLWPAIFPRSTRMPRRRVPRSTRLTAFRAMP